MSDSENLPSNDSHLKPGERPTIKTIAQISDFAEGARPTLKTISRMTGLAVATVSRALHDAPDIGSGTKKRVQETADRIGYRPNRAGVRLRTGKTNVISLVLSTDHDVMNHTARLIASIAGTLRGTTYHMNVTPYFPTEDPMAPIRYIVETQSADAIILNQIQPRDPRIAYLMERNFAFAAHGRSDWAHNHAYYDFDNGRFGELGIEQLAQRNRKTILLVSPPMDQNYAQDLMGGAVTRGKELATNVILMEGTNSDSPSAEIEAAVARYLSDTPEICGVICASTTSAMAAVSAIEDMGLSVGKDVDVFSKEAIPFLKRFRKPILTVHEDVGTAGNFLAKAVMQRIADPTKPPMQGLETPKF
jgi:LacI family transcriptional regulator